MKKPITDVKVDKSEDCPFNDHYIGLCSLNFDGEGRDQCDETKPIPDHCPLRQHSIRVNIGSKGLASVDGRVKG